VVRRGGVFLARLNPTEGSEQAGHRPVVVVSRDAINQNSPVVIVVPLTDRKNKPRIYPSQVVLKAGDGGLAYAASGSCCSSTVMRYNMTTNSFSGTGISGSWYGHLTTNQSGSRFILSNTLVYAAPSSLSGNLHNGCIGSALAPDGNHAYCYDSAASGVRKYDLQAPLQSGAIFTQTGTVATSSPGTYWDTSPGVVTPDGSFYIVGGKDKILVTPVY